MRGATCVRLLYTYMIQISIHAPHAGRDSGKTVIPLHCTDFNPRAPCGARLARNWANRYVLEFQSTRPMRGATANRMWMSAS